MNLTMDPCPHRGCEHGERSHSLLNIEREYDVVSEYGACTICTSERNLGTPGKHLCAACRSAGCEHVESQHNDKGCHAVVAFTEDQAGGTEPVHCNCERFT